MEGDIFRGVVMPTLRPNLGINNQYLSGTHAVSHLINDGTLGKKIIRYVVKDHFERNPQHFYLLDNKRGQIIYTLDRIERWTQPLNFFKIFPLLGNTLGITSLLYALAHIGAPNLAVDITLTFGLTYLIAELRDNVLNKLLDKPKNNFNLMLDIAEKNPEILIAILTSLCKALKENNHPLVKNDLKTLTDCISELENSKNNLENMLKKVDEGNKDLLKALSEQMNDTESLIQEAKCRKYEYDNELSQLATHLENIIRRIEIEDQIKQQTNKIQNISHQLQSVGKEYNIDDLKNITQNADLSLKAVKEVK